jgi:hypothetical protein
MTSRTRAEVISPVLTEMINTRTISDVKDTIIAAVMVAFGTDSKTLVHFRFCLQKNLGIPFYFRSSLLGIWCFFFLWPTATVWWRRLILLKESYLDLFDVPLQVITTINSNNGVPLIIINTKVKRFT